MTFHFFQCPVKLTTLQAVVCPGPNPLHAEVCIKNNKDDGLEFYYMDQKEWHTEAMPEKVYSDPIQEGLRTVIGRTLVRTFKMLTFKYNNIAKKSLCQEGCIYEKIDYVTKEAAKCVYHLNCHVNHLKGIKSRSATTEQNVRMFQDTFSTITFGFIAWHLLNTLSTCKVGKTGICLCVKLLQSS